jgi:xanthine dehydrogenase YagS FAD-binding subunit
VIVAITIPAQPAGARGAYLKLMDRQAWAYALVSVAAQVALADGRVERARLALGGVANAPRRALAAEAVVEGQRLTPELAAQAGEQAVRDAAPLAHNGYKIQLARELVRRALLQAAGMEW